MFANYIIFKRVFQELMTCYNNYVKIKSGAFEGANPELVLNTVFGYDSFRDSQNKIITSILSGNDTLAIMPTGGGKSLCYQIPALILEGITIVVSPLISLMQDQVASLNATGIKSVFLNSSLTWEEYRNATEEIIKGQVKIVYISPEGLSTSRTRELFSQNNLKVSLITVDEAHCVSQWGHDFRPDYMEISTIRRYFPDAVMAALTATATDHVRQDIIKNLSMKNPKIYISSFNRENIFLEVMQKRNATDQVVNYVRNHRDESGIIYCNSRKQVDELTDILETMGMNAKSYHAGLTDEVRAKNQELFVKDEVQIMVATIAFGMGIDKPNVRYVINYDLPKSIEEYYQEIGRAGRDGLPSYALLLYSAADIHKIRWFFEDSGNPEQAEALLQGMVKFATSRVCRRQSLLAYFGEKYSPSPENAACCCDICKSFGGKIPLEDMTIPMQKLLSCIIRTKERFGAAYVIDVLMGSRSKRIIENEHNFLSTWGIGNELCKEDWFELVSILENEGILFKSGDYNILQITQKGYDILSSREKLMLPFIKSAAGRLKTSSSLQKKTAFVLHKKTGESIVAEKPGINDFEAEKIIKNLKDWRKKKASDMNVPPYVIFGDKTMYDIAAKKPKSKSELKNIYGLGSVKIENFGNSILALLE